MPSGCELPRGRQLGNAKRTSVVKLRITQGVAFCVLCSGAMVNNTARDCRQLMLSAFHCVYDLEEDDWPFFKVQYNYEYFRMWSVSPSIHRTRTGVIHLTDSDDMPNGQINGSDFLLVEVEDPIPDNWEPFLQDGMPRDSLAMAGWAFTTHQWRSQEDLDVHVSSDRTATPMHPPTRIGASRGGHRNQPRRHRRGSSGSPIFEENHRSSGTLTGGRILLQQPYPQTTTAR